MRYDPVYDTWVAVAGNRQARPTDVSAAAPSPSAPKTHCPFCEGNELETPAEVDAIPRADLPENLANAFWNGSERSLKSTSEREPTLDDYRKPNAPGWMIRSVPNRYPFVRPDAEPTRQQIGPYFMTPNVGKQEVLIDVPYHGAALSELSAEEFQYLIHFYHRRLHQLRKEGRWRYVQLFKNQGAAAGASLSHPHSQITALPFVPPSVSRELLFLTNYQRETGRCYHCEVLAYERTERWRLVDESSYYGIFCPFASRYAGEIHVVPKRHMPCFLQSTREELDDLAVMLRQTVRRLEEWRPSVGFNLVLKTSPWHYTADGAEAEANFHWRFEICPRIACQAGFELGTGCFVNPIPPEEVAAALKKLKLK